MHIYLGSILLQAYGVGGVCPPKVNLYLAALSEIWQGYGGDGVPQSHQVVLNKVAEIYDKYVLLGSRIRCPRQVRKFALNSGGKFARLSGTLYCSVLFSYV